MGPQFSRLRLLSASLPPRPRSPHQRIRQQYLERLEIVSALVVPERDADQARRGMPRNPHGGVRSPESYAWRGLGNYINFHRVWRNLAGDAGSTFTIPQAVRGVNDYDIGRTWEDLRDEPTPIPDDNRRRKSLSEAMSEFPPV